MNIDIINVDDALEALALRSVLEYWGCTVALHHIATAQHLVQALGGETALSKHIVLMCHGVELGLALPELAPEIAAQQPYQTALSPAHLKEFLHLPGCLVVNTGCLMGKPEFAAAFLQAGCHGYIGLTDYPEGSSSLFYVLHFFYELHVRNSSALIAHQKAAAHDAETQMFQLHQQAG